MAEIRDAELALRPYWRAEAGDAALAAARSAALGPGLERAAVEAAIVMDAASAALRGRPPSPGLVPPGRVFAPAGGDLRPEAATLIQVSRFAARYRAGSRHQRS